MANTSTNIEIFNQINYKLNEAAESALTKMGHAAVDYFLQQFDMASKADGSGGSNDIGTWPALKDSTKQYKAKHGDYGAQSLKTTGKLYDAIKNAIFERSGEMGQGKSLTIKIECDYASYQNDGTDKIPARPFIQTPSQMDNSYGLQQKLLEAANEEISSHLATWLNVI